MELDTLKTDFITFDEVTLHLSNFKNFLGSSSLVMNCYKTKPRESLDLLTYTLYFFEQVQKKNKTSLETDLETNLIIYQKLIEINSLWKDLLL